MNKYIKILATVAFVLTTLTLQADEAEDKKWKFYEAIDDLDLNAIKSLMKDKKILELVKTSSKPFKESIDNLHYRKSNKEKRIIARDITLLFMKNGADIYDDSEDTIKYILDGNYHEIIKYLIKNKQLKKYQELTKRDNIFFFVRSLEGMNLLIDAKIGKITDRESRTNENILHSLFTFGLTQGHGIDCKNLGELKQFIEVADKRDVTPLENLISNHSPVTKEEKECFKDVLKQVKSVASSKNILAEAVENKLPIETIKTLIEKGADINHAKYAPPIYYAVTKENEELVALLLKEGVNLEYETVVYKDRYHKNLLMLAVKTQNKNIINMLLNAGMDINQENEVGQTALFTAQELKLNDTYQFLLSKGAKPVDLKKIEKQEWLNYYRQMIHSKDYDVVKKLILDKKIPINTLYFDNKHVLSELIKSGWDEYRAERDLAKFLINNGIDLNSANQSAQTLLAQALNAKFYKVAKLLINKAPKIEIKYIGEQFTYLKNQEIIDMLLAKNPDLLYAINPFFGTLLTGLELEHYENNQLELFKHVIKKLNLKKENRDGVYNSLFAQIEQNKHSDVNHIYVKLLLERGVSKSIKFINSQTPLIYAVQLGSSLKVVKLLVTKGIINHKDSYGKTALNYAYESKDKKIIKFLEEKKAIKSSKEEIEKATKTNKIADKVKLINNLLKNKRY